MTSRISSVYVDSSYYVIMNCLKECKEILVVIDMTNEAMETLKLSLIIEFVIMVNFWQYE